jgi:hypothetical protein
VLRFLPIILLCGCVSSRHDPQPYDTRLNEEGRDWVETYRNEMRIANENDDKEAWQFFFYELIRERINLHRKKNLD